MLNLSSVNPDSPSSLTLNAYIIFWSQQTQTAASEVLLAIFPNRPLNSLQYPETTEYHDYWVIIRPVYRIRRFIFIHYQATNSVWTHVTSTVATHQSPNSILHSSSARFSNTLAILCHAITAHTLELEAQWTSFSGVIFRGDCDQPISQYPICPALRAS